MFELMLDIASDRYAEQKKKIADLRDERDELREALHLLTLTTDCEDCNGKGDIDGDACRHCGGYGFNPDGDIRNNIIEARAILAKYQESK